MKRNTSVYRLYSSLRAITNGTRERVSMCVCARFTTSILLLEVFVERLMSVWYFSSSDTSNPAAYTSSTIMSIVVFAILNCHLLPLHFTDADIRLLLPRFLLILLCLSCIFIIVISFTFIY